MTRDGSPQTTSSLSSSSLEMERRTRSTVTPYSIEHDVIRTIHRPIASVNSEMRNLSVFAVGTTVELPNVGTMIFDSPFERLDFRGPPILLGRARLIGRRLRLCRYARVEVELAPWSATALQLRISPQSRHIHLWGIRRGKRYWLLAHAAASALREMLESCSTSVTGDLLRSNG
jgi:hypothetical protein